MYVRKRKDIDQLQDEIRISSTSCGRCRGSPACATASSRLSVLRSEDPAELTVIVELAGVDPDDVHIYADDRTLVVYGERRC